MCGMRGEFSVQPVERCGRRPCPCQVCVIPKASGEASPVRKTASATLPAIFHKNPRRAVRRVPAVSKRPHRDFWHGSRRTQIRQIRQMRKPEDVGFHHARHTCLDLAAHHPQRWRIDVLNACRFGDQTIVYAGRDLPNARVWLRQE